MYPPRLLMEEATLPPYLAKYGVRVCWGSKAQREGRWHEMMHRLKSFERLDGSGNFLKNRAIGIGMLRRQMPYYSQNSQQCINDAQGLAGVVAHVTSDPDA